MTPRRTYWIDLTDLSIWRGNHSGIQRVVYNLARYYEESGDARFFTYDEQQQQFYEVSFSSVQPPVYQATETLSYRRRLKQRVIYELKTKYSLLPLEWRAQLTPRLKPVMARAWHYAHHSVHLMRQLKNRPAQKRRPLAHFQPEDAVVLLGAGWARPTILEELWRRKQAVGFKLFHFIHDIIPVYFPHLFGPGHFELSVQYFFDVAATCDGIIANSQNTKHDFERFCGELNLPNLPIGVIRLGDEIPDRPQGIQPQADLVPGQFIVVTGTIENRKNHALLYYVYKLAAEQGIELPKLVIVGRQGWNTQDLVFMLTHDPQLQGTVLILKNAHDVELTWLYENCLYAVYPSTYEGWGLPVAEALVMGKLCLTANVSSMPEIAGDLIDYFSPFDSGECLKVMQKYLDPDVLRQAEQRIRTHYRVQTWEQCYQELQSTIEAQFSRMKP
jgi:glycosyltransferase involved in cell wall biosynthesis